MSELLSILHQKNGDRHQFNGIEVKMLPVAVLSAAVPLWLRPGVLPVLLEAHQEMQYAAHQLCYHALNMKQAAVILWASLGAFLLVASDYHVKAIRVLPIESYPARISLGDVTIAADPYATNEKSFTAFDIKDLNSHGYFPLHVIIVNSSHGFLTIRTRNVLLITKSGQQLYTTPATIIVEDIVKAGLVSKLPKLKSHDQSTSTKSGSPLSDFTGKELTNRTIDPGTVSDGFLFFFTREPKKNPFEGSTLFIPKLEEEGTRRAFGPFSIPLDPALEPSK